jgi:hypothetical protein
MTSASLSCGSLPNIPNNGVSLHSENIHFAMQLIRTRVRNFPDLRKINICGLYMQINDMRSPKMSDCGSHLLNFTLHGCSGNQSVSHIHRTLCFSLEDASRNAFVVEFFILELRKLEPMLKEITPSGDSSINF